MMKHLVLILLLVMWEETNSLRGLSKETTARRGLSKETTARRGLSKETTARRGLSKETTARRGLSHMIGNPCYHVVNADVALPGRNCSQLSNGAGGAYLDTKACWAKCEANPECTMWRTNMGSSPPWCWNFGGSACHNSKPRKNMERFFGFSKCKGSETLRVISSGGVKKNYPNVLGVYLLTGLHNNYTYYKKSNGNEYFYVNDLNDWVFNPIINPKIANIFTDVNPDLSAPPTTGWKYWIDNVVMEDNTMKVI